MRKLVSVPPSQRSVTQCMPHRCACFSTAGRACVWCRQTTRPVPGTRPVRGTSWPATGLSASRDIDDVDEIALAEDKGPHLRVPPAKPGAEMNARINQLADQLRRQTTPPGLQNTYDNHAPRTGHSTQVGRENQVSGFACDRSIHAAGRDRQPAAYPVRACPVETGRIMSRHASDKRGRAARAEVVRPPVSDEQRVAVVNSPVNPSDTSHYGPASSAADSARLAYRPGWTAPTVFFSAMEEKRRSSCSRTSCDDSGRRPEVRCVGIAGPRMQARAASRAAT